MSFDPDDLLAGPAVQAAVDALAERNVHHLQGMTEEERTQALAHWRELATDVLTAARAAIGDGGGEDADDDGEDAGRAVILLQDGEGDDVRVHVTFHPQLEDLGDGELGGTPAQVAAMMLLDALSDEDDGED